MRTRSSATRHTLEGLVSCCLPPRRKPWDTNRLMKLLLTGFSGAACALALSIFSACGKPAQGGYDFSFDLPASASTSAAVFDSSTPPHLIRTLWGGVRYGAGTHKASWDGNDDSGAPAAGAKPYTLKLLTNNVKVTWDGWIGNSGDYATGTTHLKGLEGIVDICATDNALFALRGYTEAEGIVVQANTATPNQWVLAGGKAVSRPVYFGNIGQSIATDGEVVYLGIVGNPVTRGPMQCSVLAFRASDSAPLIWSSVAPIPGVATGQNNAGQWLIMDGVTTDRTHRPTSLAVQKRGSQLAVGMVGQGVVEFFDKRSGAPAASPLSVAGVTRVQFSPDDSSLWVSAGATLSRYALNGQTWAATSDAWTAPGEIRSFSFDPKTGRLAVLCGGTDQRVHFLERLSEVGALGQQDAYHTDPTVADDKFMIAPNNPEKFTVGGGLSYQPDGELWVVSDREHRALRFPPGSNQADAHVMWTEPYQLCMDPNTPSRIIISGGLEFQRDWTKPLRTGSADPGWSYVKNWLYGMDVSRNTGINVVVTAPNNRVYGIQTVSSLLSNLVELTPKGVRLISKDNGQKWLGPDMSQWSHQWAGPWTAHIHTILKAKLSGFDDNGNPSWEAPATYCTMPSNLGESPSYNGGEAPGGGMPFQTFPDGTFVSTNTDDYGRSSPSCYYLGFTAPGATEPFVKTAQGEVQLPLARNGRISWSAPKIARGFPTCWAVTSGNVAAIGMNGEFWDASEANQVLLYHSSGLFVAQFGERFGGSDPAAASMGGGGNFKGVGMTTLPNGDLQLVHSCESSVGASEWKVSGMDTIKVATATLGAGPASIAVADVGSPAPDVLTTSSSTFSDDFRRGDANGWTGPSRPTWKVDSGLLVSTAKSYRMPSPLPEGALLLRPEQWKDSTQTIQIPAQLWDTSKILNINSAYQGWWGLASRYQKDGRCFVCFAKFVNFVRGGVPVSNGAWQLQIGLYDAKGNYYWLAYDRAPSLPENPGHAYSLTFASKWNPDVLRTDLTAALTDETDHRRVIDVFTSSDEPGLQQTGQIGIVGGCAQNVISGYTASNL